MYIKVWLILSIILNCNNLFADEVLKTDAKTEVVSLSLDEFINSSLLIVINKIKDSKGKVAVMDFPSLDGASTGLSAYIANKAGNKLIENNRQVVDRSTLEKVIAEQKLQQNSLMDAATAAKVGKLAGAGVFLIGNYTKFNNKFVLTVRALSVELGQFIPGAVSEEVIKNLSNDFNQEVNELINTKVNTSSINLNGTGVAEPLKVDSTFKNSLAEIEFDNQICKVISSGTPHSLIFKKAYETGAFSVEELVKEWWYQDITDAMGDKKNAMNFGNWIFNVGSAISPSQVSSWIKGESQSSGNMFTIHTWMYSGNRASVKGIDRCAPNTDWWNTKRGGKQKK